MKKASFVLTVASALLATGVLSGCESDADSAEWSESEDSSGQDTEPELEVELEWADSDELEWESEDSLPAEQDVDAQLAGFEAPSDPSAASFPCGHSSVQGAIEHKYYALGGRHSFLGCPTTNELPVKHGRYNRFVGGRIYWSPATGAHEVHGAILARYVQLGGASGPFGFPKTDELAPAPGSCCARSVFECGEIVYNFWNGQTKQTRWCYAN